MACGEVRSGLSDRDLRALGTFDKKLQVIRDATVAVGTGLSTGMYVYGPGGIGKSYAVFEELDRLGISYHMTNSRMTPRGLFDVLKKFPDEVHVMEDMESVLRSNQAQGVFRSALWAQGAANRDGRFERPVTWSTSLHEHSFVFTGGIIMTGNRPLFDVPELDAVRSRIAYIHLQPTSLEIIAKMREVALRGFQHGPLEMDADECRVVCEFVIQNSLDLTQHLDLRLLINSFRTYLQWQECLSGCSWEDLVLARIRGRSFGIGDVMSVSARSQRRENELRIASEIRDLDRDERVRRWREETGMSQSTLYRRLTELEKGGNRVRT